MNRKLICLFLCVVLCFSLMACGNKQEKAPTIPAAFDDPANTEATSQQDTAPNQQNVPATTESQQEMSTAPEEEAPPTTEGQSGTQPTLPPDVDVSVGVVKGEDDGSVDEDLPDTPATQPPVTTPSTQPTEDDSQMDEEIDIFTLTYEGYNALSGEDQKKVIDMFGSADDFMRWYKAVEAQYKEAHPDVEIGGDGSINAGDLAG